MAGAAALDAGGAWEAGGAGLWAATVSAGGLAGFLGPNSAPAPSPKSNPSPKTPRDSV
jgi:hypothetical protein